MNEVRNSRIYRTITRHKQKSTIGIEGSAINQDARLDVKKELHQKIKSYVCNVKSTPVKVSKLAPVF